MLLQTLREFSLISYYSTISQTSEQQIEKNHIDAILSIQYSLAKQNKNVLKELKQPILFCRHNFPDFW